MLAKQLRRLLGQFVEGQCIAAQRQQFFQYLLPGTGRDMEWVESECQCRQREIMRAAVEQQYLAGIPGIPQVGISTRGGLEAPAIVDQAHFGIGVRNDVHPAGAGDAGNGAQRPEAGQLLAEIGNVLGVDWLDEAAVDVVHHLCRIGGDDIEVCTLVCSHLLAQDVVVVDQRDVHMYAMTLLEYLDQVRVGVAWPRQDTQRFHCQGGRRHSQIRGQCDPDKQDTAADSQAKHDCSISGCALTLFRGQRPPKRKPTCPDSRDGRLPWN